MTDEMRQEERIETLLDFLDGEAVIVDDETICFAHNIYLDGECLECGQPLQGVNL